MNSNTSPTRVVAFVDIIGWKSAFQSIGHDGLVEIATEISKHKSSFSPEQKKKMKEFEIQQGIMQEDNYWKYQDISFSFISDCFVISASPNNVDTLMGVTKWACMTLFHQYGLLTRGGITMGKFTHDMTNDIAIGIPLNEAVKIEQSTKMPRIVVNDNVKQLPELDQLIYFDGEYTILNIANASLYWLIDAQKRIDDNLNSNLGAYEKCKWKYISEHLPRMNAELCAKQS